MNDDELERRLSEGLSDAAKKATPPPIDVEAVRARADATRRNRRVGFAGVGLVAVLAVAGVGTWLGGPSGQFTTAAGGSLADTPTSSLESSPDGAGSAASEGGAAPRDQSPFGSDTKLASPEKINACGTQLAEPSTVTEGPAADSGLSIAVSFPAEASVGAASVAGEVIVTNVSDATVNGSTQALPVVALAGDGVTVWHTNGPMIDLARIIALKPGESMALEASFTPVRCDSTDEENGFRENLPALPAGPYTVSALVPFYSDAGDAAYIISEPAAITLR